MKNRTSKLFLYVLIFVLSIISQAFTADTIILPRGKTIYVMLSNEEKAEELEVGSVLDFQVRDEVRINNYTVVVTNAPAQGEVIRVDYDEILIELRTVKAVDGQNVNIRGRMTGKIKCRKCPIVLNKSTAVMTTVIDDVKIIY